jgi:PhnB protein
MVAICGKTARAPDESLRTMEKPMTFKPAGYNSVSPYLIVNGAQGSIDFLIEVFGAQALRIIARGDGRLAHGEVRIDDTVVMLTDAVEGWPAVPTHVHIYVSDVDAVYERALRAGARSVQPPVQKDDPDKRGGFEDAGGTTWWIAQQMI